MDRDTLNWLYRLLIAGTVFIAIYSIFDSAPFFVRAIGNVLVLGALLFLVDVQASNKFSKLFWAASTIWAIIVCHSAVGFVGKSPSAVAVFQTITYSVYAIALLSVVLFSWAMRQLCIDARLNDLDQSWKTITRVSATYYSLPFVAFLGMFVGRAVGAEVQLFYGVDETSSIPASVAQYLIRVLFFLPPILILVKVYKTREAFFSILRPNQRLNLTEVVPANTNANAQELVHPSPARDSTN